MTRISAAILLVTGLLLAACASDTTPPEPAAPTATIPAVPVPGQPVKSPASGAVYRLMENGHLRHIRDWATFLALGYEPGDILELPDDQLADYPLDPALTRWVTGETDSTRYFLRRGQRYPVPDALTFALTGGHPDDVTTIPDTLLAAFPLADEPLAVPASFDPLLPVIKTWTPDETRLITDLKLDPALVTLAADPGGTVVWAAQRGAGLLRFDRAAESVEQFTTFNSSLPDNTVTDLAFAPDGTLWFTTTAGLVRYGADAFKLVESGVPSSALAITSDGTIWLAGRYGVGRAGGPVYDAFDHPLLLDDFSAVQLDEAQNPLFEGQVRVIHFDGSAWTAIDRESGSVTSFDPDTPPDPALPVFPNPHTDYAAWLQAWPRPERDNGRCLHYLQYPAGDDYEILEQIARLEQVGARWALVNYTVPAQLPQMAPLFAGAGIRVVWRPYVRPYETYDHWADDVRFLRALDLPPYIQVYNEPSLAAEWGDQPVDQAVYLDHLVPAVQAVLDAGGYPGLQTIDPAWTRAAVQRLADAGIDFSRLFFIPHMYGANHPPEYDQDITGMLCFRDHAAIFEEIAGFVPPMIGGEGGWRPGERQDNRYPAVSDELHRDYHVAVFEWFRTGTLSNGEPLPDYLFAFCPWLISDPYDVAAWWDHPSGDRTLTIQAVEALPEFTRRFSWE
jgi:hypothetical protein